ncbi:CPBP family intramembrane glutamic endopeptidase [Geodermatophilus sabuli]|uniref:CAAX protease self-immunity n=1 Tax=Geodermatophilus sabuli TaxID=1564158 RepID=A0A285EA18_9ACTN|nr:CPBP family intramembrane glutamic endopeptidase [Geodermatophilus sabuli]MBB3082064.1 membrane protease YdiL (CAAX protease family) [Geodermatophilus sabuli]SNX95064.1 CAAX protease self-immunity [Geodermatophilus sabuli]
MQGLPASLADYGPAALSAVVVAGYLVLGEPLVGHVLHRRFEGRLRTDAGARRSFYRRLLVLEWGLAVVAVVVWLSAPGVPAAGVGLRWPQEWPGPVSGAAAVLTVAFVVLSTRALRSGALAEAATRARRPGEGRHAEPSVHATLALLPRTTGERRLFTLVGVTAGVCEEWLYRGFFLAVVAALAGGMPTPVLVAVAALAFGLAHAYQGVAGVLTTGVLGGVLAGLYLDTGSLLLPVLLHVLIDLRFLLVPATALPAVAR